MSKIIQKANNIRISFRCLGRRVNSLRRNYSDDKSKDVTQEPIRRGVLHDKQQSILEESFFHKEDLQLLKELKKKIKSEPEKKDTDIKKD